MTRTTVRFMLPLALLSMVVAGCGGSDSDSEADSDTVSDGATETEAAAPDGQTIRVRGQAFSESVTIAEVYGQYLQGKGYDVEVLTEAGFRDEAVTGIETGELDLIIDYIGSAQAQLVPDAEASSDPDEVSATLAPFYETIDATLLEYSPAVDGNAYVVRGDEEATTISDTAGSGLVFGASAQCFERPQCFIGLTDPEIYGIEFADTVTLEFGPLLGEALAAEEVDAVVWNTTAPQIETEGFKVLEDDQGLFSADNIAPIVRTEVLDAYGEMLADDLNELSAQITTEDLLAWNVQTDIELRESDDVAAEWLEAEGLL
jgi:osmoprotectant transport system substrate-binding protein